MPIKYFDIFSKRLICEMIDSVTVLTVKANNKIPRYAQIF